MPKVLMMILIAFTHPLLAVTDVDIDKLVNQIQNKFIINVYIKEIPSSVWPLDFEKANEGDNEDLYKYLIIFEQEFSKYPVSFIRKTRLNGVSFVRSLGYGGQLRTAIPDYRREVLFFDFMRGNFDQVYQRHVIHHEFYHMIEQEFNQDAYWKDPKWIGLNKPDVSYGKGGMMMQGNSNAFSFTHPDKGFVNLYSKSAPEEDKAEVYAGLFIKEEYSKIVQWMRNDSILENKVKYMKSFLKSQDDEFHKSYWSKLPQREIQ